MPHRYITGDAAASSVSPISAAVVAGSTCYVSDQLSTDPQTGTLIPGTTVEEATRAFDNVFAVLTAAGFAPTDVVYIDLAFVDLADLADANAVFTAVFSAERRPARTVYQAAALPLGARIKVQGIAVRADP